MERSRPHYEDGCRGYRKHVRKRTFLVGSASVRTFCQWGVSPRHAEPYRVKPKVTASSTREEAGFAPSAGGDGVESNWKRMRSP